MGAGVTEVFVMGVRKAAYPLLEVLDEERLETYDVQFPMEIERDWLGVVLISRSRLRGPISSKEEMVARTKAQGGPSNKWQALRDKLVSLGAPDPGRPEFFTVEDYD